MGAVFIKIVIPGGSGQVGRMLARHFHGRGDEVIVLSRVPLVEPWKVVQWYGVRRGAWLTAFEGSDVCINLTGRSVNCRYSVANRREILESRVLSTRLLNDCVGGMREPPRVWLNASTATIYRHALDRARAASWAAARRGLQIPGIFRLPWRRRGRKRFLPGLRCRCGRLLCGVR